MKRETYYANDFILPPECDALCIIRTCYNKYEDKGSFSQGRGYTSYYKDFRPACGTRLCHGCPSTRNKENETFDIECAKEILSRKGIPKKFKNAIKKVIENHDL